MSDLASRYYSRLLGAWSGPFTFELTDRSALQTSNAPRFTVEGMALLARVTGSSVLSTTLRQGDEEGRVFRHTTRLSKWGVTAFESQEEISIEPDGRSLRLVGEMGFGGSRSPYESLGEIAQDAEGATYRIPWLGVTMIQATRIHDDARELELTQTTDFSFGRVRLVRQATY
ncbi:MAG: hypothetical protein U0174_07340 [Polyangiaceae bacterium]